MRTSAGPRTGEGPPTARGSDLEAPSRAGPSGLPPAVVWIALVAMVTALAVAVLARRAHDAAEAEWEARLAARCAEQAEAVAAWVDRLRTEAALISAFPTVRHLVGMDTRAAVPFPVDQGPRRHLETILDPLIRRPETLGLAVTAPGGERLFEVGVVDGAPMRAAGSVEIRRSVAGSAVAVVGATVQDPAARAAGRVVLVVDCGAWLYPYLQRRPAGTVSVESSLVRVDDGRVEALSPLRGRNPSGPGVASPASAPGLGSAAESPSGTVGRFRGVLGRDVHAAVRTVAGTDWRLVTEVDRAEVVRHARTRVLLEGGLLVAVVAALGMTGALLWVARQRQHRREVARVQADYRRMVETAHEGIMVLDRQGRIVFANRRLGEMVGFDAADLVGNAVMDLVDPADREAATRRWARRQDGQSETYELAFRMPGGGRRVVMVSAAPLTDLAGNVDGVLAMLSDVTELKSVEDQLRQAQKLEAVGRLAGGVAHDFNNLLQAMLGAIQLARLRVGREEEMAARLDELSDLVERGARLTRQLLLFARRESAVREVLDLGDLLGRIESLLRRLLPDNVAVVVHLESGPMPVLADAIQLEQVVMNLAVNGADAMPDGGRLTIAAGRSAAEVWLRVSDTGPGVPQELRERVFETFFTTKERGVGTGLGLSVVERIVRAHGGTVELEEAAPGRGASFTVRLPSPPVDVEPQDRAGLGTAVAALPRGDGELVLVVEDESAIREGLGILLEELGYRVALAETGDEAEAAAEREPPRVLAADLVLPDTTGDVLADRLRERFPALGVVLLSGYDAGDELRRRCEAGELRFVRKPFGVDILAEELRAALGDPGRG